MPMSMIMSICVGYNYYADVYLLGTHVLSKLVDGCWLYCILFVTMFYGKNKNKQTIFMGSICILSWSA